MVKLTDTARLWLSAYDRLEGDAHTNTLRLWLIGSGKVLAACLDGRTGYVVMVFRA